MLFIAVFSLMISGYAIPSAIADTTCTPSSTTLCLIIEETSNDESTDDAEKKIRKAGEIGKFDKMRDQVVKEYGTKDTEGGAEDE